MAAAPPIPVFLVVGRSRARIGDVPMPINAEKGPVADGQVSVSLSPDMAEFRANVAELLRQAADAIESDDLDVPTEPNPEENPS